MTQEKIRETFNMFTDCWRFYKRYAASLNDSDQFWTDLTDEANRIDQKYNTRLCRDLLVAIVAEVDFLSRNPGVPRPMGKPLPGKQ